MNNATHNPQILQQYEDITTLEGYKKLCSELWHHNKLYFIDDAPEISDETYDALLKLLEDLEQKHPDWVSPASPSQRIGEVLIDGFATVTHSAPMLSFHKIFSREEIEEFVIRMKENVGREGLLFSTEIKMDGASVAVRYENGVLVQALTRGSGKEGSDITANVKTIASLPLQLHGDNVPEVLEVRGEIVMPRSVFDAFNEQRRAHGEDVWANPRNAAAGALKLLDPKKVAERRLAIYFYVVAEDSSNGFDAQYDSFEFMRALGLPTIEYYQRCCSCDEICAFVEKVNSMRETLPYDIDGVVIKLDDMTQHDALGATRKHPRWAEVYKFNAKRASTHLKTITVQLGRTGTVTPVAELVPVFLDGSTISRATLHNEEEIQKKDIRIGDSVIIEKGGDIIPKVVEVNIAERPEGTSVWSMPVECPSCGTPLVRVDEEVAVRCPNTGGCPEQLLRRIAFFASKHAFDVEHLGEKVVEQLVNKGLVRTYSDIYILTREELLQLEGFKEKSADNVLASIEKSKDITLTSFIMGLGIQYVGSGTAELIATCILSIENLFSLTEENLLDIDGIGPKVAHAVIGYLSSEENVAEVCRLLERGVTPRPVEAVAAEDHLFNGKTFVLTGTLPTYSRAEAAKLIKERGGKVTSSVTKKTDYLLAGDKAGSKYSKAEKLGVEILSEYAFEHML
jgi:DNA ligase (NAD+)